jgi:hypothetical protein
MKAKNESAAPTLPGAAPRRASLGPLSAEVPRLTKAALGSRGFAEAGLMTDWASIVGAEIGGTTWPVSLKFPMNRAESGRAGEPRRQAGVLTVQAGGGAALELQHLKPQILERINAYFGYCAVAELKVQQGSARPARRRQAALPPPSPEDRIAVAAAVDGIADAELKATLTRLGMAIRSKHRTVKSR